MVVGVGVGSCSGFLRCSYKTHKRPTPKPDNPVHRHPKAGVTKKKHVGHKGVVGGPQQRLGVSAGLSSGGTRRQAAPRPTTAGGEGVVGRGGVGV